MTPAATALAAGHVPSMARSHPDASRPPASHLKGDTDGRSLQLFYLKEKKKKDLDFRGLPVPSALVQAAAPACVAGSGGSLLLHSIFPVCGCREASRAEAWL